MACTLAGSQSSLGSPPQARLDADINVFMHRNANLLTLFLVNLSLYTAILKELPMRFDGIP